MDYQPAIIDEIVAAPNVGVWVGAGLGKTFCAIRAVERLLADNQIRAVLVVAPAPVVKSTWPAEIAKFAPHLRVVSLGTPDGWLIKKHGQPPGWGQLLRREGDVYLLSYSMLPKLRDFVEKHASLHPNMIVLDESHYLKDPSSAWRKALVRIRSAFRRRVLMTATPYTTQLTDYWSAYELMDDGKALGTGVTAFRHATMLPHPRRPHAWVDPTGDLLDQRVSAILAATKHMTIVRRSADYLKLPEMDTHVLSLPLGDDVMAVYDTFKEDLYMQWEEATGQPVDIYAANADVLVNKLQQFTAGFLYGTEKEVARVHRAKIDAIRDITADGEPTLVFTGFIEEANALREELGAVHYKPGMLPQWDTGLIKIMTMDRRSCVGLNLQAGGARVVWSTLPWTWADFEQGNARLRRTGQTRDTSCYVLCGKGTVDENALGAMARRRTTAQLLLQT